MLYYEFYKYTFNFADGRSRVADERAKLRRREKIIEVRVNFLHSQTDIYIPPHL